jgi:hypothetical protein
MQARIYGAGQADDPDRVHQVFEQHRLAHAVGQRQLPVRVLVCLYPDQGMIELEVVR